MIHNPIRKALPDLSNPGAADDLRSGKQLVGADGSIVTGTLPEVIQATPTISVSSGGLITASATQSGGIVEGGTKSSTKQLPTQGAKTVTPGTTAQTAVASGRYTTGAVTVKGDANLKAENIAEGVSIFGVDGTHSGGGSYKVKVKVSGTEIYYQNNKTQQYIAKPGNGQSSTIFCDCGSYVLVSIEPKHISIQETTGSSTQVKTDEYFIQGAGSIYDASQFLYTYYSLIFLPDYYNSPGYSGPPDLVTIMYF